MKMGLLQVSRHGHQLEGATSPKLTPIEMKSVPGWAIQCQYLQIRTVNVDSGGDRAAHTAVHALSEGKELATTLTAPPALLRRHIGKISSGKRR